MRPFAPLITLVTSALLVAGLNIPNMGDSISTDVLQRRNRPNSYAKGGAEFTYYDEDVEHTGKPSCQQYAKLSKDKLPKLYAATGPHSFIPCGTTIHLEVEGHTVDVVAIDTCPECPPHQLDLCPLAFGKLAPLDKGRIHGAYWWDAATGGNGGDSDDNDDDDDDDTVKNVKGHKGDQWQWPSDGKGSGDQWRNGGKGGSGHGQGHGGKVRSKIHTVKIH